MFCTGAPNSLGSGLPDNFPAWNKRRVTSISEESLICTFLEIAQTDEYGGVDVHEFVFVFFRTSLLRILQEYPKAAETAWTVWGPSATRWLNADTMNTSFPNMSHGQRFVWIAADAEETTAPLHLLNFNPSARISAEQELPSGDAAIVSVVSASDVTIIEHRVFAYSVESSLPYVETISKRTFSYGGLAVNEDNILGFKVS